MNRFKFFMAMLIAGGTTLAFYGCGDNQTDDAAKKAEEPAAEVKVQDNAAAEKAEEEAEKAKAEAEKKAQEEAKAKAEAEKKAQEEAKKAKEAAILAQAEQVLQTFLDDIRSKKIKIKESNRVRILRFKNEKTNIVSDSYIAFWGYIDGNKKTFHFVKKNGKWQCVEDDSDWKIRPNFAQ